MQLTEQQKKEAEIKMVETIITALEKQELRVEDLNPLAKTILERIDHIHTREELADFITELNSKWPVFQHVASE